MTQTTEQPGLPMGHPDRGTRRDPLYKRAASIVRNSGRGSISLVQRELRIGYNYAAMLLEAMEGEYVTPMQPNGQRRVLRDAPSPYDPARKADPAPRDAAQAWMELGTGQPFYLNAPKAEAINVQNIASALGKLCRYNGHCRGFYSVAEHSVLVAELLDDVGATPETVLAGLLHDAHEAYTGDMTRPMRQALGDALGHVKRIEHGIQAEVEWALMFSHHINGEAIDREAIKHADTVALAIEYRDLGFRCDWSATLAGIQVPRNRFTYCHVWDTAAANFRRTYHHLLVRAVGTQ